MEGRLDTVVTVGERAVSRVAFALEEVFSAGEDNLPVFSQCEAKMNFWAVANNMYTHVVQAICR